MTYNEFKKQAGIGTNIAVGAGIGAVGGGLASLLPTSVDKKKRLRRALMLMGSGAIIGGSTGAAISKLPTKKPVDNITTNKPTEEKPAAKAQSTTAKAAPRPLPGDPEVVRWATRYIDGYRGKKLKTESHALADSIYDKYAPYYTMDELKRIVDQIDDLNWQYLNNYVHKAIKVPQGGKPRKK
jgi:hypothetical protein